MNIYNILTDWAIASLLILLGQLIRAKVKFFQMFFVPASLIAGLIAIVLGPNFLNILPWSEVYGSYAGMLIILVFTVVGINGFEFGKTGGGKEELQRLVGFQMYRLFFFGIQFLIPILVTSLLLVKMFPNLNEGFGVLLASGFIGGHGTAAAVGTTLANLGWAEGGDLGMTFATIGILVGIFVGLVIIKLGARKGWTCYVKDFKFLDNDLRTGLVSRENRNSIGETTISPVSLDTLAFHFAIILGVGGMGYLLNQHIIAPYIVSGFPDFTVSFIVAMVVFLIFKRTPVYDYVDKGINSRISGFMTDYLVFFGVASIKISVIIDYAVPLIIMSLVGIVIVVFTVLPMGWLMNKKCWFEHSIFGFGYATGVFAIGFVLLRIVDPENRSMTVEDTAITPFNVFTEIIFWSAIPSLLVRGMWTVALGLAAIHTFVPIIISLVGGLWYPKNKYPLDGRGGFNMPDSE